MIPNGVFTPYPPANGWPPGPMWQETQCPSAARTSPLAIDSALKLAGLGGAMGAIGARQDNQEKPSSPRKASATTATAMRRIIAPCLNPASLCQGRDP